MDSGCVVATGAVSGFGRLIAETLAREIADAVLRVIRTPAGQRQLRHRVSASDLGISRISALTGEVRRNRARHSA